MVVMPALRRWGLVVVSVLWAAPAYPTAIRIGSKSFTESFVLAEIAAQVFERDGVEAEHLPGMGGTIILWRGLLGGTIDVYPEYTGTIREEILKDENPQSRSEMVAALNRLGVGITDDLGFNNTYALVMRRPVAEAGAVTKISDLRQRPHLRVGLTHEFLGRGDGWEPLSRVYSLSMPNVRGIEHSLAYTALLQGEIDVMDAYSTDAKLGEHDLAVLEDDRSFFPQYRAVYLYRLDYPRDLQPSLQALAGTIDAPRMIALNIVAERTKDYALAAATYFDDVNASDEHTAGSSRSSRILRWMLRHLQLVGVSLVFALLVGVPLGIRAARPDWVSQLILGATALLYTIPSLALLAILVAIPFFGISVRTAIFALTLYSLLPIVRNTATGLQTISPLARESAAALGLEPRAQLRKVFLPLAMPTILAGIKTSAIINVATATLAALIGAGGLGEPIISGMSLNDPERILEGAIPAGVLAVAVQLGFEGLERLLVSPGLQLQAKR